jgi:hypothetical protein
MWDRGKYRPLSVAYYPAVFGLIGTHATLELLWSVIVSAAFAGLLFGVLRRLGLPTVHAFAIAALVLAAPTGDAAVLWPSATPIRLAGALYLGGLFAALTGLRAGDARRSRRLHAVAVTLYVSSIWLYELTAALAAVGLFAYLVVAPPRRALRRWAIDMAATVVAMAWTLANTPKHVMTLQEQLDHARLIGRQLWTMYDGVAAPGWFPAHVAALLTVAAIGGALVVAVVAWRRRWSLPGFAPARRWAIAGGIAFAYAIAAYVVFAPADPYYSPAAVNFGNRVNGVGVAPLVVLAYSAVMVLATVALHRGRSRLWIATAVGAVYAVGMFLSHNGALHDHERLYVQAWQQEQAALDAIQRAVPHPARGTYLVATGVAPVVAKDLPVFYSTWDLQGAVRARYDDGSLDAYNAFRGAQCAQQGVYVPGGNGGAYGRTVLVDVPHGRAWLLRDAQTCVKVARILAGAA